MTAFRVKKPVKKTDTDRTPEKDSRPVRKDSGTSSLRKDSDTSSTGTRKVLPPIKTIEKTSAKTSGPSSRPPTKQQLRLATTYRPPGVSTPTTLTRLAPPQPLLRWPTIGKGEKTSQENIDSVRSTWNMRKLADLWVALSSESP